MEDTRDLSDGRNKKLRSILREYRQPDLRRSLWQVTNSIVPFVAVWYLMYRSLTVSYWIALALAAPAAGFLLRIFVLQHDLGHGSLFKSRKANDFVGSIFGVLTLIPYHHWRRVHNEHHRHFGKIDRDDPGYLTTLSVAEYNGLPRWQRWRYRIYRHPFVVLIVGGLYYFIVQHRFAYGARRSWKKERWGVYSTNVAILLLVLLLAHTVGWRRLALVHLPILFLSSTFGVWMFLNQHCFENTCWQNENEWSFTRSALEGSSYYKLPRVLSWFTASVGFHHVHHMNPMIPNYRLEECHREVGELRQVDVLTLRQSLRTPWLALWDEKRHKMVSFRDAGLNTEGSPGGVPSSKR